MSGTGVLLDSCVLIDHLNGVHEATAYFQEVGAEGTDPSASLNGTPQGGRGQGLGDLGGRRGCQTGRP